MLQPRATVCLLLSISLTCVQSAESGNFEDADRGSDYATSSFSDVDGQWDLRHSIPGEPEIDYPIYSIAPKTSFSCENRHEGYYADVETRCQVFRICTNTDLSGEGFAFLCPNGTLFSQKDFVCNWYRNVDCTESENYYFKNEEIGSLNDKDEVMKAVKEMVEFPMKTISKTIQKSTNAPNSNKKQKTSNNRYDSNKNRNQNESSNKTGNRHSNTETNFKINVDTSSGTQSKILNNKSKNEQQYQNHGQRNDQNNNENRNKSNGRKTKIETKEKERINTNTNRDRDNSNQSDKFTPPKVYVNSLGELSTDPGVNFDPKSSLIIEADQSSRRGKNRNREQKKSLDDVLGDRSFIRNQVENERREKLKQGLPGTDSKRIRVASKVKATYSKDKDSEQDHSNSERVTSESKTKLNFAERINAGLNGFLASDSSEITGNNNNSNIPEFVKNFIDKKTNKKQSETKILEDNHERFLNLADNVNGGFLSNDQSRFHHTNIHKEYHLEKTVGFENENSNQHKKNRGPKIYSGEDNLSEPIQPLEKPHSLIVTPRPTQEILINKPGNEVDHSNSTKNPILVSNIKIGQAFQGSKTTESSLTKSNIDEYRSGRQFQFFGSGFTKPGQTSVTLAPFSDSFKTNKSKTNYLPDHVQPFITQLYSNMEKTHEIPSGTNTNDPAIFGFHGSKSSVADQGSNSRKPKHQNILNRDVVREPGTVSLRTSLPVQNTILNEENNQIRNTISKSVSLLPQKEIIIPPTPSSFYLPQTQFISRSNQPASNIPDLFLMVGDINAAEETKQSDSSSEDVTVKRRAEALLVQGVQQAFFENEYNENSVENALVQQNATQIFDPLVIHVDEDERKDSDVTNIEKLLVGNIRNFLRVGIENEIKSKQNLESTTSINEETLGATEETTIVNLPLETITPSVSNNTDQTTISVDFSSTDYSTTFGTESEIFNTTEFQPTTSTKLSNVEITTLLPMTTYNLTHFSVTKQSNSLNLKSANHRRLTVKPINYSKKPYTVRTYPKTNTTIKPNKFTNNIKRRPLNRFALKDTANNNSLTSNDTVPTSLNEADNDSNDLQAIANSYRSYRPTTTLNKLKIQNDTFTKYSRNNRYRLSNIVRNRYSTITTTPNSIIATPITTTVSSVNSSITTSSSKTNISFTNLIPFDILSKAIHGNTETSNLQNSQNRFLNTHERSSLSANDTIRGTQKTFQTSPKALYTQIPGTNIKISKSNEEASFSFDPQIGLKPQPVSSSQQTGYVPLEQYITQTLSKTLSSPEYSGNSQLLRPATLTPSLQHITVQPTISTHSQNNIFSFSSISQPSSSPSLPTLKPAVVNSFINNLNNNINSNQNTYSQQQSSSISIIPSTSTFYSQPSQINNLQPISNYFNTIQQATHIPHQQSALNLNTKGHLTSQSVVHQDNKQLIRQQDLGGFINNIQHQEQEHPFTKQYQTLAIPNPTTSSFSFNQFGNLPPQPILLNSQTHQKNQAPFEQIILDNAQRNHQLNNAKGYPPNPLAIFNEIPIAQRRFDLEDVDTRSGKSIYSGVSSYHVPLGSVGRLAGDITATKRFRRSQQLFS